MADTSCFVTEGFQTTRDVDRLYRLSALSPNDGRHLIKKDFYMANKRARDSGSGRFIPVEEARRRPKETTVETIRKPCPKKKES
ncbi:competence protein CinA [Pseudomonas cichorii]|uniref:competence protein CinA n=1 Tax=Pseudomonas cichorii TaxID=36746 RepID=UPI001910CF3A|nr:competence protein CinA [Pseudomonas cichorii]